MKVTQVSYERLRVTKPYENERVGVVITLDEGETAAQGVTRARKIVDRELNRPPAELYERAKAIVDLYEDSDLPGVV